MGETFKEMERQAFEASKPRERGRHPDSPRDLIWLGIAQGGPWRGEYVAHSAAVAWDAWYARAQQQLAITAVRVPGPNAT